MPYLTTESPWLSGERSLPFGLLGSINICFPHNLAKLINWFKELTVSAEWPYSRINAQRRPVSASLISLQPDKILQNALTGRFSLRAENLGEFPSSDHALDEK